MKKRTKFKHRRFSDAEPVDLDNRDDDEAPDKEADDGRSFPGIINKLGTVCSTLPPKVRGVGDTDAVKKQRSACAAKTSKICTAALNDLEMDFGDKSRKEAWQWCADAMKGKPRIAKMSEAALDLCLKPDGSPMSREKCRKTVLAGEGKTAVGFKLKLGRSVVSKGSALVTKTVKGADIVPQIHYPKKPCRPAGKKGEAGIRDCHYELEFFDQAALDERGVKGKPGPYLRICNSKDKFTPGGLYPVTDPASAKRLLDKHCDCRTKGGDPMECSQQSEPVGFGKLLRSARARAGNRFGLYGYGRKK